MIKMTTTIFDHVCETLTARSLAHANAQEKDEEAQKSWMRGREGFELDIYYRWSEIIFNERYERADGRGRLVRTLMKRKLALYALSV